MALENELILDIEKCALSITLDKTESKSCTIDFWHKNSKNFLLKLNVACFACNVVEVEKFIFCAKNQIISI